MPFFALIRVSVLKSILSDINNPNLSFLSVFIGIEHLFPTLHFQSVYLLISEVSLLAACRHVLRNPFNCFIFLIFLFIWLSSVLVAACGI